MGALCNFSGNSYFIVMARPQPGASLFWDSVLRTCNCLYLSLKEPDLNIGIFWETIDIVELEGWARKKEE